MKKLICLFLILSCFINCKDREDDPSKTPQDGESISIKERLAALDTCQARFLALQKNNSPETQQQFVSWLKDQSYFAAAGIASEENNIWARFHDGRFVMFVNNLKKVQVGQQGGKMSDQQSNFNIPSRSGSRISEIPSDKKVIILNGMGTSFIDPTNGITQIFAASKTNYQVSADKASIDNLKKIKGDHAIVYLSTHGGAADSLRNTNGKPTPATLGFWTTDAISEDNETTYKEDLDNHRLGYMIAFNDQITPTNITIEKHYAFTSEFVKEHMKFGENSLIYFTACNGFRQSPSGVAFRETIISKAKDGKAAYLGWTQPIYESDGYVAAKFMFDRLLGANAPNGGSSFPIPQEDPYQRPFDIAAVMKDMDDRGLTKSNVTENGKTVQSVLMCYNKISVDDRLILAPSIAHVNVYEVENKLHIAGIFGSDPKTEGEVTVDGVALKVESWKKDEIVCIIPQNGKGSAGDVIVKVRNQQSNAVQLTEWLWKIDLTRTFAGSLKETINLELHIRADVHSYRKRPHAIPSPYVYTVPLPNLDSAIGIRPVNDSKGLYTAGGTGTDKWSSGDCSYQEKEVWSTVSANLPILDGPVSSPRNLMAPAGWLNPKTKTMEFSFTMMALGHNWTYELITSCPGGGSTYDDSGEGLGQGLFVTPYFAERMGNFEDEAYQFRIDKVTFDENFNIKAYQKTFTQDSDDFLHLKIRNKKRTISIKWAAVTAKFPPKKNSGARLANNYINQ